MKYVKMFGLLVIAASALMATEGIASATTLTSPTGTVYTGTITAGSEGSTSIHGSFVTVTCKKSHVQSKVEQHGVGVTAAGNNSILSFAECNFPVKVLKGGSLEWHIINCNANDECTATITLKNAEITIETSIANCLFTASSADITLTPTHDTGGRPIWHTNSELPRTGHSIFCGSSGTWTGTYGVTTPATLWVNP